MRIHWKILIGLFVLVGTWIGVLSARNPWITPLPGVRLEPLRPLVRAEDINPDSAYARLLEAIATLPDEIHRALYSLDELPPPKPDLLHTNTTLVLDYYGPALDLARRAARAPQETIPPLSADDTLSSSKARWLSRALAFSANFRMAEGDLPSALDDVHAALQLTDILTRGGGTFAHLVDSGIKLDMSALLVRMLAHTDFPVDSMHQLQMALREMELASEPAAEGLRQDWRAFKPLWDDAGGSHRRLIKNLTEANLWGEWGAPPALLRHLPAISALLMNPLRESRANVEAFTAHYLMLLERPYDGAALVTLQRDIHPGFHGRSVIALWRDRDPIGRYIFILGQLFHSTSKYTERMPAKIAALRAAQAALAVHRYRVNEGRLPNDLSELVPAYLEAVPLDPYDGQPLRYRPSDGGSFTLYSVGTDGRDDGGNGQLGPYGNPAPDLVF